MLNTSGKANQNYLSKVVQLGEPSKHPNADRLQGFIVDYQVVYTDLSYSKGDLCIFFPIESQIHEKILHHLNLYEDKTKNSDPEQRGFFNKHGRVRAVKLRSEKSEGFLLKITAFNDALSKFIPDFKEPDYTKFVDTEFDSYNDVVVTKKYVAKTQQAATSKEKKVVKKKESRLIDNQFRFHIDTLHLKKNVHKINPFSLVSITSKIHGSSAIFAHILTKRKLNWFEKLLKHFNINIVDSEYDFIYSSRRVIKNQFHEQTNQHYYDVDAWDDVMNVIKDRIMKGVTIYGEIAGYTRTGRFMQKDYDYGCIPSTDGTYVEGVHFKFYVYRITITNVDGDVFELPWNMIKDYCNKMQLRHVPEYYFGRLIDFHPSFNVADERQQQENIIKVLSDTFLEKDCEICVNDVPDEGIIVRVDNLFDFDAQKLKSFKFLQLESKHLDEGVVDMETEQSQPEDSETESNN